MKQATDQDLQLGKWLGGAALGALAMYMLDPDRGAPRRAVSGEKLRRLGRQTGDALDKVMHGAGTRAAHAAAHAADAVAGGDLVNNGRDHDGARPDEQRPGLGGMLRHGAESLQSLRQAVGGSDRPDQEAGDRRGMRDVPPGPSRLSGRGTTLAGASVLGLAGLMAPRSPLGMAMGLAGLALLVRATGKRPVARMLSGHSGAHPVEIEKTIRIDAAPEKVFDLFANYENFPRFMSNVIEVRDLGDRRSHWVVKGPAGSHFAWNAVLTEHSRPRRLAWESEPGAEVQQSGSIQFEPIHSGTRVTVRMDYQPPAGAVGHALASLLGSDPKRQMDEDLARMKSLVERGAMTQAGLGQGASDNRFLH